MPGPSARVPCTKGQCGCVQQEALPWVVLGACGGTRRAWLDGQGSAQRFCFGALSLP